MPASPLRVRINLNLAKPELAENAVRIQAPTGAWITVGYATELVLAHCQPVVDLAAQQKISQGSTRKIPHAFIEGDLLHFKGRLRSKAPPALVQKARPHLVGGEDFQHAAQVARDTGTAVNYNPRFAKCFYEDRHDKSQIDQRFVDCERLVAVGWSFRAQGARWAPLLAHDRCAAAALEKTSLSEKVGIRRGRETTEAMAGAYGLAGGSTQHARRGG